MEASLRCSKPRPCKQQANALQVDGPVATVRNAGPVAVTPLGLHAIRWMGLWPSSAMVVALELLERKRHSMGTRSTTMMIAICSAFRRTSGSMRRRTPQRPPTKAWRAQKPLIASLRRSSAACFFSFLCRLCLTRRFGLLCSLPSCSPRLTSLPVIWRHGSYGDHLACIVEGGGDSYRLCGSDGQVLVLRLLEKM